MKILDYALAMDGGTQVITLDTGEGGQICIGLDGRMDAPLGGRQLFIGNSPVGPEARMLAIGGAEEAETISLLQQWREQSQGFLRREFLMDADPASLEGQDLLDCMGMLFLRQIEQRDLD